MTILTMKSTIKTGKYGSKAIADLVNIKGKIFAMIKDGYIFDDEVLKAAHITRTISNVHVYSRVGGDETNKKLDNLGKDTLSVKQIISELNTIDNENKYNGHNEDYDNWNNGVDTIEYKNNENDWE